MNSLVDEPFKIEKNPINNQKETYKTAFKSKLGNKNSVAKAASNNPKPKYPYIATTTRARR